LTVKTTRVLTYTQQTFGLPLVAEPPVRFERQDHKDFGLHMLANAAETQYT
jgi:hypothetical protein